MVAHSTPWVKVTFTLIGHHIHKRRRLRCDGLAINEIILSFERILYCCNLANGDVLYKARINIFKGWYWVIVHTNVLSYSMFI